MSDTKATGEMNDCELARMYVCKYVAQAVYCSGLGLISQNLSAIICHCLRDVISQSILFIVFVFVHNVNASSTRISASKLVVQHRTDGRHLSVSTYADRPRVNFRRSYNGSRPVTSTFLERRECRAWRRSDQEKRPRGVDRLDHSALHFRRCQTPRLASLRICYRQVETKPGVKVDAAVAELCRCMTDPRLQLYFCDVWADLVAHDHGALHGQLYADVVRVGEVSVEDLAGNTVDEAVVNGLALG